MSLAFMMLNDPRGGFVELPAACSSSHCKYDFLYRMNELRNAYLRHLLPLAKQQQTLMNIRKEEEENGQRHFVALHHFHPKVVREFEDAGASLGVYKVPMTMKSREIKRLGLKLTEEDRVVDLDSGKCIDTDEYFFVPNYSMDKAYEDLKQLSRAERSAADISADVYRKAKEAIATRKQQQRQKRKLDKLKKSEFRPEEGIEEPAANPATTVQVKNITTQSSSFVPIFISNQEEAMLTPPDVKRIETSEKLTPANKADKVLPQARPNLAKVDEDTSESKQRPSQKDLNTSSTSFQLQVLATKLNQKDWNASNTSYNLTGSFSSRNDMDASNTTVVNGYQVSNRRWQGSSQSIQVPALQASDSTFHGSGSTIRASGGRQFQISDSTIQRSNVTSRTQQQNIPENADNVERSLAEIDFPITELPKRQTDMALPSCETPGELSSSPSPNRMKSSTLPFISSPGTSGVRRVRTVSRRLKEDVAKEEEAKEGSEANKEPIPPNTSGTTPKVDRFQCVATTKAKINDASPITPKRIRSSRHMEDGDINESINATSAPMKDASIQFPATIEEDIEDKDDKPPLTRSLSDSPLVQPKLRHSSVSKKGCSDSQTARRENLFDRVDRKTPRRTKSAEEHPANKRWTSRSKSGDVPFRRRSHLLPRSTKSDSRHRRFSADTIVLFTRTTPRPSLSDSSGSASKRTSFLSPGPKRLDKTRKAMLDLYRTLQEDESDDKDSGDDTKSRRRTNMGVRRTKSNTLSEATIIRRNQRRKATVAEDDNYLGKLRDRRTNRNVSTPRRTKSDSGDLHRYKRTSAREGSQNSQDDNKKESAVRCRRASPMRTKSDMPPTDTSRTHRSPSPLSRTLSGFSSVHNDTSKNIAIKRIDNSKRALQNFALDTNGSTRRTRSPVRTRSQSPVRRTHSHSPQPLRKYSKQEAMQNSSPAALSLPPGDELKARSGLIRTMKTAKMHSSCPEGLTWDISGFCSSIANDAPEENFRLGKAEGLRSVPETEGLPKESKLIGSSLQKSLISLPESSDEYVMNKEEGNASLELDSPPGRDGPITDSKTGNVSLSALKSLPGRDDGTPMDSKNGNASLVSLTFEDLGQETEEIDPAKKFPPVNERLTKASAIPANFYFSYPIPSRTTRGRKGVDWEKLSFSASFPIPQRKLICDDTSEDGFDREKMNFELPSHLMRGRNSRKESPTLSAGTSENAEDSIASPKHSIPEGPCDALDLDRILMRRPSVSAHRESSRSLSLRTITEDSSSAAVAAIDHTSTLEEPNRMSITPERLREIFPFHAKRLSRQGAQHARVKC